MVKNGETLKNGETVKYQWVGQSFLVAVVIVFKHNIKIIKKTCLY